MKTGAEQGTASKHPFANRLMIQAPGLYWIAGSNT